MNLQEIIGLTQYRLDDAITTNNKNKWSVPELVEYANDAQDELARRLYLFHESDTIGYLVVSGSAGQVDSVSVSGVVITSGVVVFSASTANTARLVAAGINAHTSSPNYRAVVRGTVVVIRAIPGTGYPAAGYAITAVTSGGLTAVVTDLPGLCRQVIAVGQRHIALSDRIIKITRFKPLSSTRPIDGYTKEDYDAADPRWESRVNGVPGGYIPDYENNEVIVVPPSMTVDNVEMDCYRLPLVRLSPADLSAIPEVPEILHRVMPSWMLRQSFLKNDEETLDLARSKSWEAEFDRQVEAWKVEKVRRMAGSATNRIPGGLM